MYLSFYNLQRKPFQMSTDPDFLWMGKPYREALALLKYGVLDNKGFLLLTGDVGSGKTILTNSLLNGFGNEVLAARVPDPGMSTIDFMNCISHAFNIGRRITRKPEFLVHFENFLSDTCSRQKKVLLVIDEAQRLSSRLLEEIRLFSNIGQDDTQLLNILLVGSNELRETLMAPDHQALRQLIAVNSSLRPLDRHETGELIQHRLQVAGAVEPIFSPGSIDEIYCFSEGIPRKINVLCDSCLMAGFVEGMKNVSAEMVARCKYTLCMPGPFGKIDHEPISSWTTPMPGITNTSSTKAEEVSTDHTIIEEPTAPDLGEPGGKSGRLFVLAIVGILLVSAGLFFSGGLLAVSRDIGHGWQQILSWLDGPDGKPIDSGKNTVFEVRTTFSHRPERGRMQGDHEPDRAGDSSSLLRPVAEQIQAYTQADEETQKLINDLSDEEVKRSSDLTQLENGKADTVQDSSLSLEGGRAKNKDPEDVVADEVPVDADLSINFSRMNNRQPEKKDLSREREVPKDEKQETEGAVDEGAVESGEIIDWLISRRKSE